MVSLAATFDHSMKTFANT